jgi:hypothetical protein
MNTRQVLTLTLAGSRPQAKLLLWREAFTQLQQELVNHSRRQLIDAARVMSPLASNLG